MRQAAQRSREPSDEVRRLRAEIRRLTCELRKVRTERDKLAGASEEDPLTGLLNRRGLVNSLTRAVSFVRRYRTQAALLFIDLDAFKPINDAFGHEAGDRVLQHVALCLKGNLRASDIVGRFGGDEFMVLLWQATQSVACAKAEALEAAVAEMTVPGLGIAVRISVGAASILPDDDVAHAITRADRAMYARKAARPGPAEAVRR
jgi:diguanylate cyclase (GGDEF)-like protein